MLLLSLAVAFSLLGATAAQSDSCATPDQQRGRCVSIHECQLVKELLQNAAGKLTSEVVKKLQSYQCGYDRVGVKVCCLAQDAPPPPPDVSKHKNVRLLPTKCGRNGIEDKIIYGEKTALNEFPWMALISYRTRTGPQFQCGGTIINSKYILTAAHCIKGVRSPIIGVRVGEYNIQTPIDCEKSAGGGQACAPPHQDVAVEEILPHPRYDPTLFINDIGLLRVSPMNVTVDNASPVCLPLGSARDNLADKKGIVTGWGVTEKNVPSQELLKVVLPLVDHRRCNEKYDKLAEITHKQICAGGEPGKGDSCKGDSGGPLQVLDYLYEEDRYVQQGVVSFGTHPCGLMDKPGVYTRVAYFMDWILDTVRP